MNARDLPGMGDSATFPFGVTEREDEDDISREVRLQNAVAELMLDRNAVNDATCMFCDEEYQAIARATQEAFQATAWRSKPAAHLLEKIGRLHYDAVLRAQTRLVEGRVGK